MTTMNVGKTDLFSLGWSARLERELRARFGPEPEPARVVRRSKGRYLLRTATAEAGGLITGAFEYRVGAAHDLPVVGDWVAVRLVEDPAAPYRIEGILPRGGVISRKAPGEATTEQVLVANVDVGCIVFSLDGGRKCNPRAAERYTTMVWNGGALPIILLNKTDLAREVKQSVAEIASVAPGVEVLPVSCLTGAGVDGVRSRLPKGKTAVLLGPSGVGKSTLVNVLADGNRQEVGRIRESDLKGRHTTTRRDLIMLPGGALIIDTPGLRELALWADEEELDSSFPEIASLSAKCRFRDCSHTAEPGCAVQAALADGSLPRDRFASYLELKAEAAYCKRRSDERLMRDERERWKKIGRQIREFSKERRARFGPGPDSENL